MARKPTYGELEQRIKELEKESVERKQAEEALRENEAIFSAFLENSPVYIFFKDRNLRSLRLSKNFEQMLGMPLHQALGKSMDELFPSDFSKSMVADDRRVLYEGQRVDVVEELGGRIYETTKFPILKDGMPFILAGFTVDITERKRVEEALRESDKKFRVLTEKSVFGICIIQDAKIAYANPSLAKLLGYSLEEIIDTLSLKDLIHPDDIQIVMKRFRERLEGETEQSNMVYKAIRKDGFIIDIEVYGVLIDYQGRPSVMVTIKDITERKRAEDALSESESRFRGLFEHMTSGVAVYEGVDNGEDFVFKDLNPAGEKIEKMHRENVIGKRVTEVFPGVKEFGIFEVFQRVWRMGEQEHFPEGIYQDERDPGSLRESWVYRLPSGEIVAVYNDITERKKAEDSIQRFMERLDLATHSAGIGIWDWDIQKNELIWDDRMYELYGIRKEDFSGAYEAWLNGVHTDDRAGTSETSRRALIGEIEYDTEFRVVWPDGRIRFLKAYGKVVRDSEGNALRMTGVNYDITERKRAEEALRESEMHYRDLFDNAPNGYFRVRATDGTIMDCNRAASRLLAYPAETLRGMKVFDLYADTPSGLPKAKEVFESFRLGKPVRDVELQIKTASGQPVWVSLTVDVVKDKGGEAVESRSVVIDITERKRAEEELLRLTEEIRLLLQSTGEGIYGTDTNGLFTFINRAGAAMLGYSPEGLMGKDAHTMIHHRHADGSVYPSEESPMNRTLQSGQVCRMDSEVLWRKDGSSFPVEYSSHPMVQGGEIKGVVVVFSDITERKRAEAEKEEFQANMAKELERRLEERSKELTQSQAQLFQMSKLSTLGEMAAGIAHEMNQPLSGILLTTKLLRKLMDKGASTDKEIDSGLRETEGLVKRMSKIINHIRTFARQDTRQSLEVDVNETIDSALSLLGEQLRLHGIGVVKRFSPVLPKIHGDPYQLEQVWINLITNARDALDEKEKQIVDYTKTLNVATIYNAESEIPSVEVRFADNGIGFSKEVGEKIFEPFFTTKEVGKGTGLGMSISYGIIESHKGKIEVESKVGEGTTVNVILPNRSIEHESSMTPEK